jgi:hypothetical protein
VSNYVHPRGICVAALTATIATSSCGGGGGGASAPSTPSNVAPAPVTSTRPVTQTDLEIAKSIYSGTPRTPAGFYVDPVPKDEFVATEHLKNSDIEAESGPEHELCTNDWNQALSWSEEHAQDAQSYSDLVETNDETRFFEFGRTRASDPEFYVRQRVFKCSYVDRAAVDLRAPEGAAGLLNLRPLTAAELKTLSEYLWTFTAYNNFGSAVLESSGSSGSNSFSHSLYIASLARDGVSGDCDRIDVLEWKHSVDSSTGALTLNVETVLSFGAREAGGVVDLCSQ